MTAIPQHDVHAKSAKLTITLLEGDSLRASLPSLVQFLQRLPILPLSRQPAWLGILQQGMHQSTYALLARRGQEVVGYLPLAYLKSLVFGRFLISLPYLNTAGVEAEDAAIASQLIDRAIELADELGVKFLELRQEKLLVHDRLCEAPSQKIHMRLPLPAMGDELWKSLNCKVRNQVRKGEKNGFQVNWGSLELLEDFYRVFSRNMRDLGTPVFPKRFFAAILETFPAQAEICSVRKDQQPVAAALLLHGQGITEVPSASALREWNPSSVNMLMYWQLLQRAIERGQGTFDFGRSSPDSPTYKFKKQWGAEPVPAAWQYYRRTGSVTQMRPDNPKYRFLIRTWTRLPLWLANGLGPRLSRAIP